MVNRIRKLRKRTRTNLTILLTLLFMGSLKASLRFWRPEEALWKKAAGLHSSSSFVLACWHEHLMCSVLAHCHRRIAMLVGRSFLGDTIAATVRMFGYRTYRGSSSHGGKDALQEFYDNFESGWRIGITVEGSRGPRHQVKPGCVAAASKSGVPLLPMVCVSEKFWTLKTWDRFKIPKFFSKVHVLYGEPIMIPPNLDKAAFAEQQERVRGILIGLEDRVYKSIEQMTGKVVLNT